MARSLVLTTHIVLAHTKEESASNAGQTGRPTSPNPNDLNNDFLLSSETKFHVKYYNIFDITMMHSSSRVSDSQIMKYCVSLLFGKLQILVVFWLAVETKV